MKKNIYVFILAAIFIAGGITGCKKLIDLNPVSQVEPNSFFKTQKDADAWMAGIYNSLQTTLNGNYANWGEIRSDNITYGKPGTNSATKLLTNVLSGDDADLNGITNWENLYRTISLCNIAIDKYPDLIKRNVDGGINKYRDQLGQAYALRALLNFYTLRVFGGAPIVNDAITNINQQLEYPRATPTEMKVQILKDIDNALLTIGTSTTSKFYIQKAGVYALKTDVHMWFQEYPEAIAAANNVTGYSYITTPLLWKQMFITPEASTETIFNLYWDDVERGSGSSVAQNFGSSSNTNQIAVDPTAVASLYSRVDPTTLKKADARLWLSVDTVLYSSLASYQASFTSSFAPKFSKFADINIQTGGFTYESVGASKIKIPIYRFADVQLLKAEALARTYNFQPALDIVNAIRLRVGYKVQAKLTDYTGTNEDKAIAIQKTVLQERQLEFVGEGKRWFDLCRIGKTYDFTSNGYAYLREVMNPILTTRKGTLYEGVNVGRVLFPLNLAVINANPLLKGKQNPPYSE